MFSVDVEDGKPPLKLPYNRGEDPYKAATAFLVRNNLPGGYLEQVGTIFLSSFLENLVTFQQEVRLISFDKFRFIWIGRWIGRIE